MNFKLLFLITTTFIWACNSPEKGPQTVIKQNLSHNYQFLKAGADTATLMVLIDAHGDADLAISKLKVAARRYKFNLMALTDIENNTAGYLKKIKADIFSATKNEKLKPRKLIIGGFSGGARMAASYFGAENCAGLLLCGAGAKIKLNKPVALIIGLEDFNFYEQFYLPNSPLVDNQNLFQLVFDGKHEWPPIEDLNTAACFLLKRTGTDINTDSIVSNLSQIAENFKAKNRNFRAFKAYEAAYKLSLGKQKSELKNKVVQFKNDKQIAAFAQKLTIEREQQNIYISAFYMRKQNWWNSKLIKLNKQAESSDFKVSNSAARQKAFIGIAVYSFLNKNKSMPLNDYIKKLLYIYEKIEPKNPDLYFFKAYFNYKSGNMDKARQFLQKSKDLGESEKILKQNFPNKLLEQSKTAIK